MFKPTPLTLALACLFAPLPASAAETHTTAQESTLPAITVEASSLSLGMDDMTTPVTVLTADDLLTQRAATLGETLANQPGTHASHFGAGASRPVIRGMDGARVRILSHGSEVMDASTISQDHAVAIEPLLSNQIEILRGPSGLAYGGGASGGIVNSLDDKIPTQIPAAGYAGHVEMLGASAALAASSVAARSSNQPGCPANAKASVWYSLLWARCSSPQAAISASVSA